MSSSLPPALPVILLVSVPQQTHREVDSEGRGHAGVKRRDLSYLFSDSFVRRAGVIELSPEGCCLDDVVVSDGVRRVGR